MSKKYKLPYNNKKNFFTTLLAMILSICVLVTTCCVVTPTYKSSVIENIDTAYKSTWDVMSPLANRSSGAATMIYWEPDQKILAISAWHLFSGRTTEKVFTLRYCRMPNMSPCVTKDVTILRKDEVNDLAVLVGVKKEKFQGPVAVIARDEPQLGETVYAIGTPLQHTRSVTRGVLSYIAWRDKTKAYYTDASVIFGNSGGGLFNRRGELLGVVVEIRRMPIQLGPFLTWGGAIPGFNMAVGLPHIHKILQ